MLSIPEQLAAIRRCRRAFIPLELRKRYHYRVSDTDQGLWHHSRVIRPSLVIKDNEGQCTLCANVRFIAGAENHTISIIKQFEAHCRKAHAPARDPKIPTPTSTAAGD